MRRLLVLIVCASATSYGCSPETEDTSLRTQESVPGETGASPDVLRGADSTAGGPALLPEESTISRLDPSDIREIPSHIAQDLIDRNCTIPQTWSGWSESPNNFIQGDFARKGSTDWAVLCSDGHASRIVVVWEDSVSCAPEFAESPDLDFLARMDGEPAFARTIAAAGGDGQGISDTYQGKGGVTYFCHDGTWTDSLASP